MFGYITPAPGALDSADRELFRSYYCALCREIGKRSQPARLGLSYDMTFLALLLDAVADSAPPMTQPLRCILHPTKPTLPLPESAAISYAADMSVILIKAKLADDAADEKNPLYKAANSLIRDTVSEHKEARQAISDGLAALAEIEQKKLADPDAAADCFAKLCGGMFGNAPVPKKETHALYWLGYNLGRWIYLTDAYADLEHDLKKGSYNPFANGSSAAEIKGQQSGEIEEMLHFTLAEAAAAFDLLTVHRHHALLENIIYIGLPARLDECLHGKERNKRV